MTDRPDLDAIEADLSMYETANAEWADFIEGRRPEARDPTYINAYMADTAPTVLRSLLTYARGLERHAQNLKADVAPIDTERANYRAEMAMWVRTVQEQNAKIAALEQERALPATERRFWTVPPWADYFDGEPPAVMRCKKHGYPNPESDGGDGLCPSCTFYAIGSMRFDAEQERDAAQARHDAEIAGIVATLEEIERDLPHEPHDAEAGVAWLLGRIATLHAAALARHAAEVERVRGVEAERDELRATLANERGEGEPPGEGWEFLGHDGPRSTWRRYLVGGGDGPYTAAYVSREIDNYLSRVRWHWYIVRDSPGESPRFTTLAEGHADYAREGMRAADATLTPGGSDGR